MKKILLILGFIIGVSANGQNATYTDNDGDGVIEYVLTNDAGVVLETGFYYNRQKVRTWTSYYPNGKKKLSLDLEMVYVMVFGLIMTTTEKKF